VGIPARSLPREFLVRQARNELFNHHLYRALAEADDDARNRELLQALAEHERRHFEFWIRLAGASPDEVAVPQRKLRFTLLARKILGLTFTIRRLERAEEETIRRYEQILDTGGLDGEASERLRQIIRDEQEHEREFEQRLSDERVAYLGAAVLGLNDALIELTGGLTGLVSSISNSRLIGFTGLIVGIAASLSMGASNFLSERMTPQSQQALQPLRAAIYTGVAYILVVLGLVAPFFIGIDRRIALLVTWIVAIGIIAGFSYYSAHVQMTSFRRLFGQMLALGLGVAVVTFLIGRVVSRTLGIEV
jgi:VIT1/CCC1 family predicted Fe2+/Mn2+ transporter